MSTVALLTQPPRALGSVRWPSDEARVWVSELAGRAVDDPAILAVVIYGSAVRNVDEPGDLDLLVVHRGAKLESGAPMEVDLRMYHASELDGRIAAGDEVLGWALRFGVPVFERDDCWSTLAARWDGRLPLPSADIAEARAARALRAANGLRRGGDEDAADEVRNTALRQLARARLLRAGVFPLSGPELVEQLIQTGEHDLAAELQFQPAD